MTRIGGSDTHPNGVFEVVMLDVMMPAFVAWLDSRRLDLVKGPQDMNEEGDGDDKMPWYFIGVRPEDLRAAEAEALADSILGDIQNWKPTGIQNGGDDAVRT